MAAIDLSSRVPAFVICAFVVGAVQQRLGLNKGKVTRVI